MNEKLLDDQEMVNELAANSIQSEQTHAGECRKTMRGMEAKAKHRKRG